MLSLDELREKLYKKYPKKDIAKKLNLGRVQTSRILWGKQSMSIERYNILEEMIRGNDKMIDKIDYNKYIVIKREDLTLLNLNIDEIRKFNLLLDKIDFMREKLKKPHNKYLVLNVEDKININYLLEKLLIFRNYKKGISISENIKEKTIQIKDISVFIINSILIKVKI